MRLLLELYCVTARDYIKSLGYSHQACCLCYFWARLTVAFTCASLSFNLSDVIVVSDLKKKFGGWTDLAKKSTDRQIGISLFTPLFLVFFCILCIAMYRSSVLLFYLVSPVGAVSFLYEVVAYSTSVYFGMSRLSATPWQI